MLEPTYTYGHDKAIELAERMEDHYETIMANRKKARAGAKVAKKYNLGGVLRCPEHPKVSNGPTNGPEVPQNVL
jgi:hypothetical protein